MSLQFGHDVLQHFLPTMDRFSQKEKQVLLRHNCQRHKSSISYSLQRRGRCWQTSIFFVFFEIWLCDVLERPTVQENRRCWYFVVQAPMDKSSVTKYQNENNFKICCEVTTIIESVFSTQVSMMLYQDCWIDPSNYHDLFILDFDDITNNVKLGIYTFCLAAVS